MKIEIELNGHSYIIEDDGVSFNAYKTGETKDGKPFERSIGYCITMSNAVNKVIRDALAKNTETVDLKTYVERYEIALADCREFVNF